MRLRLPLFFSIKMTHQEYQPSKGVKDAVFISNKIIITLVLLGMFASRYFCYIHMV